MMYKLFSQREKEKKGLVSDVYIYDEFCQEFRNQILFILDDISSLLAELDYSYNSTTWYKMLWELYSREKGLSNEKFNASYYAYKIKSYCHECSDQDFLDFLDLAWAVINHSSIFKRRKNMIDSFNKELNYRLKLHSLGYEYINGELIKKTNEHIHKEIIKPALHLLNDTKFKGAEQEYLQAFEFFKKGNNKDCISNALKAFESVMKTICKENGYAYDKDKDTAKQLLQHLTDNDFYPKYLESHLTGIRTTLESGAPTLRNKKAGHGQGQDVDVVSDEYAEYALNLVATNIVLLVKIFNNSKGKQ